MRILIKDRFSDNLALRSYARDIANLVRNADEDVIVLDFEDIRSASRSFMDEFYRTFLSETAELKSLVSVRNFPESLQRMSDIVKKTQLKRKLFRPFPEQDIFTIMSANEFKSALL